LLLWCVEELVEWRFGFPFRMLRRESLDPVERKENLEVHWLLGPQGAVVVKRGDAFGHGHKIRRPFASHLLDEGDDDLLGRGVVPGGKWIGGQGFSCEGGQDKGQSERRADV